MLRAVLAVLLVAAILAVSQPVIQQGRQDHAATLLGDEVDELVEQAVDLVATDEATDGPGARRIVTIELPAERRFSAGANYVVIDGGTPSTVEWAIDDGTTHRRVLEDVRLRTPDGDRLHVRGSGRQRLLLSLDGRPGQPVVEVSRFQPVSGDGDA